MNATADSSLLPVLKKKNKTVSSNPFTQTRLNKQTSESFLCGKHPSSFWHAAFTEQWKLARGELGIKARAGFLPCMERRHIEAYIEGKPQLVAWSTHTYGGIMNSYTMRKGHCWTLSTDRKSIIEYHRIWKCGNTKICDDFGRFMHKNTNSQIMYKEDALGMTTTELARTQMKTLSFTFVREPLDHFVSAYSEVAFRSGSHPRKGLAARATDKQALLDVNSVLAKVMWLPLPMNESSLKLSHRLEMSGSHRRAVMFVKDMAAGRLHHEGNTVHRHVFPQVGFINHKAFPLNFLGNLSDSVHDSLFKNIPEFETRDISHTRTDARSGSADRAAMLRVLGVSPRLRCAVVRMLLPDYLCFGYPIPEPCGYVLNSTKSGVPMKCPFRRVAIESTLQHDVPGAVRIVSH